MLEADAAGADNSPCDGVVDHPAVSGGSSPDPAASQSPSPTTDLPAILRDDPVPAMKPSTDGDARPRGSWDWTSSDNGCSVRYPPTKPEPPGPESPQTGSRATEVETALAGVHAVLDRIAGVSERQQVLGDVIVHLQVLRCRLQLAQVNPPAFD